MAHSHFIRFAQALALFTGLSGCGHGASEDALDEPPRVVENEGGEVVALTATPAPLVDDGPIDCSNCVCPGITGRTCPPEIQCGCGVPGPLAPPDLMV